MRNKKKKIKKKKQRSKTAFQNKTNERMTKKQATGDCRVLFTKTFVGV